MTSLRNFNDMKFRVQKNKEQTKIRLKQWFSQINKYMIKDVWSMMWW